MEKPGWNYWPVVVLGLIWNLMGCLNFVFQSDPDFVAGLPDGYRDVVLSRPAWATAAFAIAVFGGAVGCILLLLRRRVAVPVLIVGLIATVLTLIHIVLTAGPGGQVVTSTGMSVIVALILWWTAQAARARDWLR